MNTPDKFERLVAGSELACIILGDRTGRVELWDLRDIITVPFGLELWGVLAVKAGRPRAALTDDAAQSVLADHAVQCALVGAFAAYAAAKIRPVPPVAPVSQNHGGLN